MGRLFKNKFRISSARMPGWDYGSNGLYFITICTKDRIHYFGDIVSSQPVETHDHASPKNDPVVETHDYASPKNNPVVEMHDYASPKNDPVVETHDYASPKNNPVVETHDYASPKNNPVVETHDYASLRKTPIAQIAHNNWLDIPNHFPFVELNDFIIMPDHLHGILFINKPDKTDWQPNKFGRQSQNLASIIRNYKTSVKTYATKHNIEFAWQSRYHDRVIRNEKEYANIREYIFNNPENWLLNGDNEDNLYIQTSPRRDA